MRKNYILTTLIFVLSFSLNAQTMTYSISDIGTNANGNKEIALIATPDFTETNGNSADMGAVVAISGGGYLLPGNTGFVNDCVFTPPATNVCDYALPATEWDATYLTGPSAASGKYVYQLIRTPAGATNVFFDAESGTPLIMAVFQVTTGSGAPTTGDIVLVDNTDPLINSEPNEDWLNINYATATGGSTQDVIGAVDTTPISFSVLGVSDNILEDVSLYPNPTNGLVSIKGIEDLQTVKVFNISGQEVMSQETSELQLDMTALQSGVYFLELTTQKGSATKKIIKQ